METFTSPRELISNRNFEEQRRSELSRMDLNGVDTPLHSLIRQINSLPYCFSLQSCYGHFLLGDSCSASNLERLAENGAASEVVYRIAYLAICVDESAEGRRLLKRLGGCTALEPDYIQFGCADWFWQRQINSYVLQVEPYNHQYEDRVTVTFAEALYLEKVRDAFFAWIAGLFG